MDTKPVKKTFNYNYASVILLYVWALIFFIATTSIKNPDSRIFPYFVSGMAIVLSTILLLKTYFKWGKKEDTFDFSGSRSAVIMVGILLSYITVTAVIGFYIATPFYLYIAMWILGQRNKKVMLMISLLMPILIFLFFDLILGMRIPQGMFFA